MSGMIWTAVAAMAAVASAQPAIRTESGDLVFTVPDDNTVQIRTPGSNEAKYVAVNSANSTVDAIKLGFDMANTIASVREGVLQDSITRVEANVATLQQTISQSLDVRLAASERAVNSSLAVQQALLEAQSEAIAEQNRSINRVISDTVAEVTASQQVLANRTASALSCAARGMGTNRSSGECIKSSPIGEPDYQSEWIYMRSQYGANSYKQIDHNLGAHPEYVKVFARCHNFNTRTVGFGVEGIGAQTCDDDGNAFCNEYAGVVFGYNNNSVRVWLPTRNNERNYGYAVGVHDGWGARMWDMVCRDVHIRVQVWRKYRLDEDPIYISPDFAMNGQGNANDRYKEITWRARGNVADIPERVDVAVQARSGANSGYWFNARGASIIGSDGALGGSQYGGLVFAYQGQKIRLWAASGRSGRLLSVTDGWGGERNSMAISQGVVRIRVWGNTVTPDFDSGRFRMCSGCHPTNRRHRCSYSGGNGQTDLVFQSLPHGLGDYPSRLSVKTTVSGGANNGFVFEGVGAGADDEANERTGLYFAYSQSAVNLYAPYYNDDWSGVIAGVARGWGGNQNVQLFQCATVHVTGFK